MRTPSDDQRRPPCASLMLAYVFWHWPAPTIDARAYEDALMGFHRALATRASLGFERSTSFRVDRMPWAEVDSAGYEDWYLLEDWSALGTLNAIAVEPPLERHHGEIARHTSSGAGAIYQLRSANGPIQPHANAHWLSKPRAMTYTELDALIDRIAADQSCEVWQRQLVLGPAPEFRLVTAADLSLTPELQASAISGHILDDISQGSR